MQTLIALIAAVAACVLALPPVPSFQPAAPPPQIQNPVKGFPGKAHFLDPALIPIDNYIVPHILSAPELSYDEEPGLEELYREIGYIDRLAEALDDKRIDLSRMLPPTQRQTLDLYTDNFQDLPDEFKQSNRIRNGPQVASLRFPELPYEREAVIEPTALISQNKILDDKKVFLTPFEPGYYDPKDPRKASEQNNNDAPASNAALEPRQTRQNPNLSRNKALVAANLDKLRIGLANKEYRLPVSLLPANLNWLRIHRPIAVDESSEDPATGDGTVVPELIHIYDTGVVTPDPGESIYGVALVAAVGTALAVAIVGFAFGWYTLSKRAKAAADVDYPAYGVTGPSTELSGDRKLAHSAHMYHYQHQKQQILAMERHCVDERNGSVSDPESEEENEEGDYTVYECPGFATTGDMEVKNPMFTEEKTPATPGKGEVVKPSVKE